MSTPLPPWNDELPEGLRMQAEPESMPGIVHERLAQAGITLHSAWIFDVPELFEDTQELYKRLAWDRKRADVPSYETVRDPLTRVFERHGREQGLTLRQRRLLWKAIIRD